MRLSQIDQNTRDFLDTIKENASDYKNEIYLVGGFVRDWLLNRQTRDLDLVVSGNIDRFLSSICVAINGKWFWLDRERGVARIHAVFKESEYQIDISPLNESIVGNLSHRDFSINSIAISLFDWPKNPNRIIDPFSGISDIDNKLVKAINGNIFRNDPSRLIRAVRIASELGFIIEKQTQTQMINDAKLIKGVAPEKIREEIVRILTLHNASEAIFSMDEASILGSIIPELEEEKNILQPTEHSWDVFYHSIQTLVALESLIHDKNTHYAPRSVLEPGWLEKTFLTSLDTAVANDTTHYHLLKLAAILHDLGKPATRTLDESGRIRFLGHAQLGAKAATQILERLRFSKREVYSISIMISSHLRPFQMSNEGLPSQRAIYRFFRDTSGYGSDIILLGLADYLATIGPRFKKEQWLSNYHLMKYIISEYTKQNTRALPKLINGHDLISNFGLKPGKEISIILNQVKEAQNTGEILSREDALRFISQKIKQPGEFNESK